MVQKAKAKRTAPRELRPEQVAEAIRAVAPFVLKARQWFAVYRVLADRKVVGREDFETFCNMVAEAVPNHERLPIYKEMQRMNVLSFAKHLDLWRPDNAPVKGKIYLLYMMLAQKMVKLVEEGSHV
jgi:hypothetical protein